MITVLGQGTKRWHFVDAQFSAAFRPQWDVLTPTATCRPDSSDVPIFSVTQNEGDVLYIPPWIWHRTDVIRTEGNHAVSINTHVNPRNMGAIFAYFLSELEYSIFKTPLISAFTSVYRSYHYLSNLLL